VKRPILAAVLAAACLCAGARLAADARTRPASDQQPDSKTLVYADFEKVENGRPVSARGGLVQLFAYEESRVHKSSFKGQEGLDPPGPELVRIKADDPNHLAKFEYSLLAPNQWAGVTLEIHGLPDADGKPVAEDVTGYKTLSLQVYATGIRILRIETLSHERGKDVSMAYPQHQFTVRQGLNTYKIPLTGFTQPAWVTERRLDPREILRRLTSINLTAFCDQCELPMQGMVIVDNLAFEK
jgi:hypothetical protein